MMFDGEREKESQTDTSKCPSCGANLTWSSKDQCLVCEHCGTKVAVETNKISEEKAFKELFKNNNTWGDETHVFRCNNCGAKEVISNKDIAKVCPFCGTTNVVVVDDLVGLKPNAVIPFSIDKEVARKNVIVWARKKIFAPSSFKKSVTPDNINGNYSPAFTFDASTFSTYRGTLGKYYFMTKVVNGKSVQERKIRYFNINGDYETSFNDILIHASDKIEQKKINEIRPFDTDHSKVYANEFLHGFTASQYTRDGEQCFEDAKEIMEFNIKNMILAKYDYDVVSSFEYHTTYKDITYKYVLLPIYVGNFTFKEKLFNFFVNGSNGKVTGKTPVSPLRVSIAVSFGLVILALLIFVLYMYFNE